jgi:hypothetical protein
VGPPTKCRPGYKLVSGYCVLESCKSDFKCPSTTERIPNRKCYDSIRDCKCKKGYTRRKFVLRSANKSSAKVCRKAIICDYGMNWWGTCKSAPK